MYKPNRWQVIRIVTPEETFYKLLAGWYGGFAQGDSWRLNSGITEVTDQSTHYKVDGHSKSTYVCRKPDEGMSAYMDSVLYGLQQNAAEQGVEITPISIEQYFNETKKPAPDA